MMPELLSAAGIAGLAVIAGAVGLRLVRDEISLRRKPTVQR
jgi:hypothetical protein